MGLLVKYAPRKSPWGTQPGKVAEWSKAPDSKSGVRFSVPWVRIPPFPPIELGSIPFVRALRARGASCHRSNPPFIRHQRHLLDFLCAFGFGPMTLHGLISPFVFPHAFDRAQDRGTCHTIRRSYSVAVCRSSPESLPYGWCARCPRDRSLKYCRFRGPTPRPSRPRNYKP